MKSKEQKIFLEALEELTKEKGIDYEELLQAIETALIAAYKRNYGEYENATVKINRKNGDVKVKATKKIVENVQNKAVEITLENAKLHNKNAKLGDEIIVDVDAELFKRNAIQKAKQIVIQKVREHEKFSVYNKFKMLENSLVNAIVKKMDEQGNLYVEINGLEAIVPSKELSPCDKFVQGNRVSIYVGKVEEGTKYTKIELSRKSDKFLIKLLEREIPEIENKDIEIKAIAREAGSRSKIAVYSTDKNLDIKGACIGKNGIRIHTILSELVDEKLDIILWNEDKRIFVKNALSPAEVDAIGTVEVGNELIARVEVPSNQLSLAIGKKGQNTRLASKLCQIKIDIVDNGETESTEYEE
ncbi:transcription termination factor NusA [Caviibacter abscessus]|uniref:transcription termination factor NusA n=1 Tax=Caviibacter abscessus TaxID=1766719 RepID=UPI00082F9781|nr:transcription termination factor NusA [Caviibacter abscessus]